MKRLLTIPLVLVFLGLLSMPVLAAGAGSGAANAKTDRGKIMAAAKKSHEKREALRVKVDAEMKERLKLIKHNDNGNQGPVAN